MKNSRIEWTDSTFNPWIGCQKVSPGCQHCYAETYGHRFGVQWGPQGERKRTSADYWRKPLAWNRQHWFQCNECGGRFQSNTSSLAFSMCDFCGSRNISPTRQRVFCASLADWAEDRPELIPWRNDFFALTEETPNLIYLLLTKRTENIRRLWPWTPTVERPNIWLGTSIENQDAADKRVLDLLLSVSGPKFLSCEPLLGPVDLTKLPLFDRKSTYNALTGEEPIDPSTGLPGGAGPKIAWVIVGGESGPHARPMHPDWARSLRNQCDAHDVPFFFKQWGEYIPFGQWDASGQDISDHAVQGFDDVGLPNFSPHTIMFARERTWAWKVGKHVAGRYLDGVIHNNFPSQGSVTP